MNKIENDFAPSTDFLKILPDLWNGRKLIVSCTVVAAILSAIVAWMMQSTFESEASLLLMPPPFKDTPEEVQLAKGMQRDTMTALMPKVLDVPDYEILLHSDGVLLQAVAQVKEEASTTKAGIWDEKNLVALGEISRVRNRLFVTTEISEKNVTSMKYSPVITLTARAETPEQAQHLAQAWAEVSQKLALTLYSKGKTGLTDFMRQKFEESRDTLLDVNRQIRDVEIEWNDELEKAQLSKKHERYLAYEEKLTDNEVKMAATKQEIASLEESFATQPKKFTLWKSPPMESVFIGNQLGNKPQADSPTDKQSGFEEEVLNQGYLELENKLIVLRSELAGMKEYSNQMASAMDQLNSDMQDLRRNVAVRQYERKMLDIQMTPLKSAYDAFSLKLQQAKVAESDQENLADIKIVADAALPDRKSWPPRTLIVLAACVLGVMASTAFLILRGFLQRAGALSQA